MEVQPTQPILRTEKEQEEFFLFLRRTIVRAIAAQANVDVSLVEDFLEFQLHNMPDDYEWLSDGIEGADTQLKREIYELKEKLSSQPIVLGGLSFSILGAPVKWDYESLLLCLPRIRFADCEFYCVSLFHEQEFDASFRGCKFHSGWKISAATAIEQGQSLFCNCCFMREVELVGGEHGNSPITNYDAVFSECDIASLMVHNVTLDTKLFAKPMKLGQLSLKKSVIRKKLALDSIKEMTSLKLISTVLKNRFTMRACECNSVDIKNTIFEGLADFYKSEFQDVKIEKSTFQGSALFEGCRFGAESPSGATIVLRYVTFSSFINFRDAKFNKALDLRNTNRQQQPNFLDAEFSEVAASNTDRETFRIIKHSFDAVGNHIEANKYYAHEMQAYRRELAQTAKRGGSKNRRERFLLTINSVISNHGQDYFRALAWLLVAIAVNAAVLANFRYQWFLLPESIQAGLWKLAAWLNRFADGFLPLRSLLADDLVPLAFWILVATVVISTLTWHVLVAMRRHRRR